MESHQLRIELLGRPRALRDGRELALGPPRRQAVLALLAVRANHVVSRDEIIDGVWGDHPPASAVNGVHVHVAALRQALDPARGRRTQGEILVGRGSGYLLRLAPEQVDRNAFLEQVAHGRRLAAAGEPAGAVDAFDAALALWHGTALAGLGGPAADAERMRLTESRLAAWEERAEAMLAVGRQAELVAELSVLVTEHPLRERLRALLMLALARGGRQADALTVYADTRRLLVDELGIEPSTELQRLQRDILSDRGVNGAAGESRDRPQPDDAPAAAGSGSPRPSRDEALPRQLPPATRHFTGREAELRRLTALATEPATVGAPTIVAITGTAGVGKTALAVHWAHRVRRPVPRRAAVRQPARLRPGRVGR